MCGLSLPVINRSSVMNKKFRIKQEIAPIKRLDSCSSWMIVGKTITGMLGSIFLTVSICYADRTACESPSCRTGGYTSSMTSNSGVNSSDKSSSSVSVTTEICDSKAKVGSSGQLECPLAPIAWHINSSGWCCYKEWNPSGLETHAGAAGTPDSSVDEYDHNKAIEYERNQANMARIQAGSAAIASIATSLMQNVGNSHSEAYDNLSSQSHDRVRELKEWSSRKDRADGNKDDSTILAKADTDKIVQDLNRIRGKAPTPSPTKRSCEPLDSPKLDLGAASTQIQKRISALEEVIESGRKAQTELNYAISGEKSAYDLSLAIQSVKTTTSLINNLLGMFVPQARYAQGLLLDVSETILTTAINAAASSNGTQDSREILTDVIKKKVKLLGDGLLDVANNHSFKASWGIVGAGVDLGMDINKLSEMAADKPTLSQVGKHLIKQINSYEKSLATLKSQLSDINKRIEQTEASLQGDFMRYIATNKNQSNKCTR